MVVVVGCCPVALDGWGGLCDFKRLVVSRVAVDYCWEGLGVWPGWQFRGLAGGVVLRRGVWSLWGPGVVAAGIGPGGRAALAWMVVLGLGPGVWALPCTLGAALPVPGRSGLSWARHGVSGLMRVLVLGWLLWDLRCVRNLFFFGCRGVQWGGAFPPLGAAWVGMGDGGSQARAAATVVNAWFVCFFPLFFFVCRGPLGWGRWVPFGCTVAP